MSMWWSTTTAPNTATSGQGTWELPDIFDAVTEKDLEHEVFKTPIRTLEALWLARFGYKFIDRDNLTSDDFFSLAGARLFRAGRIEQYKLPGAIKFRLIEL